MRSYCKSRPVAQRVATLMVAVSVLHLPTAHAQQRADDAGNEDLGEARQRYERALELSDEGNYEGALYEFQRAYKLKPTYRLLYNLGVVSVATRDYVRAIDYYTRYLVEGDGKIEPARTTEVKSQLERLKGRIGKLRITVTVAGADVTIDDVSLGKSPLPNELTVNAGRRKITATIVGYAPATALVELVGNETRAVMLAPVRSSTTTIVDRPSRPIPWIGWVATGALAVGATTTGVLALRARGSYNETVGTVGASGDDVSSDYRTMRSLSITSDVLIGATVIAAGVALYLTLKKPTVGTSRVARHSVFTTSPLSF